MAETDGLYQHPSAMEPMMPAGAGVHELHDRALTLDQRAARLSGRVAPGTARALRALVRSLNSYYSNLIEGHYTRLRDIERALQDDYSADPAQRALQVESRAHIEVEALIEERLSSASPLDPSDPEFLCWIHREVYARMPKDFRTIEHRGRQVEIEPGELRTEEVEVGHHVAPAAAALPRFLGRFHEVYGADKQHGTARYLAIASAHHRLLWIHPFLDGNGRVARLYTQAALASLFDIDGYGLWSITRGLARNRNAYREALMAADGQREGDLDGRGNLSNRQLLAFCGFFLDACLDQVNFMESLLDLDGLRTRVLGYVALRVGGNLPDQPKLRREAGPLMVEALVHGEVPRGAVPELTGLKERTARDLVSQLVSEGLLRAESHRAPLSIGLPSTVVPYWFPRLYSGEEQQAALAANARAQFGDLLERDS